MIFFRGASAGEDAQVVISYLLGFGFFVDAPSKNQIGVTGECLYTEENITEIVVRVPGM